MSSFKIGYSVAALATLHDRARAGDRRWLARRYLDRVVADTIDRGLAVAKQDKPDADQVRDYAAEEKAALAAQRERDEAALLEQLGRE